MRGTGVFASMSFQFFQIGVAESTTAYGRFNIKSVIKLAEDNGVVVLLGDTDSAFLLNPSKEVIKLIQDFAENELKISMDIDAEYRFMAISNRKKNYIGFAPQVQGITPDNPSLEKTDNERD